MDELAALFGSLQNKNDDLADKMFALMERQGDHRISPNMMLGFLGMFNLWGIMSIAKTEMPFMKAEASDNSTGEGGIAEKGANIQEALTGLLSSQAKGGGGGDLMGMLGNLTGNKKLNPAMLLPLLGLLNNQMAGQGSKDKEAAASKKEEKSK